MIKRLRNISIRGKLILMQVFTTVLVLIIVFSVFVITEIKNYKERKQASMESLAQVIALNNVSAMLFADAEAAGQMLSDLRINSPEVLYAYILDKDNKIFAPYAKNGSAASADSAFAVFKQGRFPDKYLYINKPIISEDKIQWGSVLFQVELTELPAIKSTVYNLAAILLLVAVGLSLLVASIIESYISKRLLRLVSVMKNANNTDTYKSNIADEGKDEIGTLFKVYRNLMEQVAHSQQKKDDFIGIASHELKTPLTTVKGYLELLGSMETDPGKQQLLSKALSNADKLARLIAELLDVSKIQSGQLELHLKEFNLEELLQDTVSAMQLIAPTHRIELEDNCGPFRVTADMPRIEQVLINLISNAVKYSPTGSRVMVGCTISGNEYIISVRDFGSGIAEREKENIFDRFYRARDVPMHIAGFGLGLYICRSIIKRHQGRIWADPLTDGTVFSFSLPRADKEGIGRVVIS